MLWSIRAAFAVPPPSCSISPSSATVCPGKTATFTASSDAISPSFSWSGPNGFTSTSQSITVGDNGTYTVTVTDAGGSSSMCSANLIVDSGSACDASPGHATICAGQTATFTASGGGTYSWTGPNGFTSTDASITVSNAGGYSVTVTNNLGCSSSCSVSLNVNPCTPHITVYKQVVCEQPGPTCASFGANPATDNKSAAGVSSAIGCPAFCYKITIINDGLVDLNKVTVSDPTLEVTSCAFTTALAQGASASCTITGVPQCQDTTNTVTATGQSTVTGAITSSTNSVYVTVVPVSVTCELTLSSTLDLDGNPNDGHVTLPGNQQNAPITVSVILTNPSPIDLEVSIGGLPLTNCVDLITPVSIAPVLVPAGSEVTVSAIGCALESCPGSNTLTATVVGTAVASTADPCVYDSNGNAVTTVASTCQGVVSCQISDLMISKAVVSGQAKPGQILIYTITLANLGPDVATGIVVNDAVPQGTTFLSAGPSGTYTGPPVGSGGTVTWHLDRLGSGASTNLTLRVTVLSRGNTPIVNTANVQSTGIDPNPANNTATITTKRNTR